jgi:CheY-like chemotaxis protein
MGPDTPWRLLVVDDQEDLARQVAEFLEGESIDCVEGQPKVDVESDFGTALDRLEAARYDLLILDIRLGLGEGADDGAGLRVYEAVAARRFLPIVFYTALPAAAAGVASPVVLVVEKTKGLDELLGAVRALMNTRLPEVNRALLRHAEEVQRAYMWGFVARNWPEFNSTTDRRGLAYLLARRLAASLTTTGMAQLAAALGDTTPAEPAPDSVSPMFYYLLPPVDASPLTGDIYAGTISGDEAYWILLTPSCDLVTGRVKADHVLLAKCLRLEDQEEFRLRQNSATSKQNLVDLMRNVRRTGQADRFHFLPGAVTLPDLVVDFQKIVSLEFAELAALLRLASLDSPFAEALVSRFTRFYGRLGVPNLDTDDILRRITPSPEPAAPGSGTYLAPKQ